MANKNYLKSFKYAFSGFVSFFSLELNSFIHLSAAVVVFIFSWWNNIQVNEWLWIILAVTSVFITEMMNTGIERLCDLVESETNPEIKIIKDISAAAVLLASLFAVTIGIIILGPYLFS